MSRNGLRQAPAVAHDLDPAALLDDEEQPRGAGGAGHVDGAVEVADPLQPDAPRAPFPAAGDSAEPVVREAPDAPQEESAARARAAIATQARTRRFMPGTYPPRSSYPVRFDFDHFAGIGDFRVHGRLADVDLERAAGRDAGGGLGLRSAAEAGVDAVEDREPAGLDRAQLPDPFDRRARLQRPEDEGLAARAGRASAFGRRGRGLWIAFGQDPDRPVGLRQIRLRVADPEGKRRSLAFLAGDRDRDRDGRHGLVAGVADGDLHQRGLAEMLIGGERGLDHLHLVAAFGLVGIRGGFAAAGGE